MNFVPLLLATLLSSPGDEVVARVDQVQITSAMISRRVEGAAKNGTTLSPAAALETLVTDVVLAAEARRLGLGSSPELVAFVDRDVRKAAAVALVESYASRNEPDEATLRNMFHATADFVAYEFLAYASQADAQAARRRIDKGAPFESEAIGAVASRLYPKASEAPLVMRAQLPPPLAAALFGAAPGVLVGPAADDKGWLLARLLRKEIGSASAFAARRADLVATVHRQTVDAARRHLVQQLKAKTGVTLDEPFLKGLKGAEATPEQLQHVVATVAGAPVRYADVYPDVRALGRQGNHLASPAVKVQLATSIVDQRVLEAFAVERGFDKAVAAQRPEIERNGLAGLAASRIQLAVGRPTSGEIERHYQENAARFGKKLSEVRPRVEAELLSRKRDDAFQARLAELRAKSAISIDQAALARAGR